MTASLIGGGEHGADLQPAGMGEHHRGRIAGLDGHGADHRAGRGGQCPRRPAGSFRSAWCPPRPRRGCCFRNTRRSRRRCVTMSRAGGQRRWRRSAVGRPIPGEQARLAALVRGYPRMDGQIAAAESAHNAWLARVAARSSRRRPAVTSPARGCYRPIPPTTRPYTLAVRDADGDAAGADHVHAGPGHWAPDRRAGWSAGRLGGRLRRGGGHRGRGRGGGAPLAARTVHRGAPGGRGRRRRHYTPPCPRSARPNSPTLAGPPS